MFLKLNSISKLINYYLQSFNVFISNVKTFYIIFPDSHIIFNLSIIIVKLKTSPKYKTNIYWVFLFNDYRIILFISYIQYTYPLKSILTNLLF